MTRAEKAERRDTITKLYSEGVSVDELTEQFGLGKYYIRGIVGAQSKTSIDILREHSDEVKTLFETGLTYADIGKRFGVSKDVVSEFYKENGLFRSCGNANSEETVARRIKDKSDGLLEYVSGYTIKEKPVRVRCLVCGGEFEKTYHTITTKGNVTCPLCVEYKREQRRKAKETERQQQRLERIQKAREREAEAERKRIERIHPCPVCGTVTDRPKYCSKKCGQKVANQMGELRRRNLIQAAMVDKDITVEGLYRRDNGVCAICGKPCNLEDYVVRDGTKICGDWYPSIDHVIPLAKGGLHSWSNVQLAHRRCNWEKSDSI